VVPVASSFGVFSMDVHNCFHCQPLSGRQRLWRSCVRRGLRPRAAGDLGKPRATRTWGGGSVWRTAANGGPSNPAIALPLARIFRASGKPIPPGANLSRQLP
jgi:hypothetical protein